MYQPDQPIEDAADGCRLHLYARPRSSRTEVAGLHGNRIKLKVAAPPVDGAANDEIIDFVASELGVRKSDVEFVSGQTGKRKTLHVFGVSPSQVRRTWNL
jgi:uncharacterized protein